MMLRTLRERLSHDTSRTVIGLTAERVLRLAGGVVVLSVVARTLGPSEFGLLGQAVSLALLFCSNAGLGTERLLIRDLAAKPEDSGVLLGTAAALRFAGTAILGAAACAVAGVGGGGTLAALAAVAVLAWLLRTTDVIELGLQARKAPWRAAIPRLTGFAIGAGLQILVARAGLGAAGVVWGGVAEAVVAGALLFGVWRRLDARAWRLDASVASGLLRGSWPILAAGVLSQAYQRIDLLLIGRWCGNEEAGIYAASSRLIDLALMPAGILQVAMLPHLLEWQRSGEAVLKERFTDTSRWGWVVGLCVALPIAALSPWVIGLLFGAQYAAATVMVQVRMIGVAVMFGAFMRAALMSVADLQVGLFVTTGIGLIFSLIMNALVVPSFGGLGAAVTWTVTQILSLWVGNLFLPRSRWMFRAQAPALPIARPPW